MQPFMDPLHLCIALGPLAVYLLVLGIVNVRPWPFLTNGARDATALGIGISGLVVAGPMELFFPESAAARWGWLVWLLLMGLYALGLAFLVLIMRPRLIVYNITMEQLRPVIAEVVERLDAEARWSGDTLVIRKLHVQMSFEANAGMRNVQLIAVGGPQSYAGWWRLETDLAAALAGVRTSPNPYAISFLTFSLLLLAMVFYWMAAQRLDVAQEFQQMFRL